MKPPTKVGMAYLFLPHGNPYMIYVDYNSTTHQGDVVIFVQPDQSNGVNAKTVTYTTVDMDGGGASTFTVTAGQNPNRKVKGTNEQAEMAIRVLGQFEIM